MTAAERFNIALITIASNGLRPHCSDAGTGDLWISEHPAGRAEAALLCTGCPVFDPCGKAADADPPTWGVWASRDFSRRPGRKKAA
jgi:hypothetical protein